jgi:hypothetical protein
VTIKSYEIRYSRTGVAGLKEMLVTVYNASTGDTVSFGSDLSRIESAAIVARSNNIIAVSVLASTATTSNNVCLPAGSSLAGDDFDMIVVGPALSSAQ